MLQWKRSFSFSAGRSLALEGVYVYDDRVRAVFDPTECLDEGGDVVALFYIDVVETQRAEIVAGSLSAAFAQQLQVAV